MAASRICKCSVYENNNFTFISHTDHYHLNFLYEYEDLR